MGTTVFAAMVFTSLSCPGSTLLPDSKCTDGTTPRTYEMSIFAGEGACDFKTSCADRVATILEIKKDGQTILVVPVGNIDRDAISSMWRVIQNDWEEKNHYQDVISRLQKLRDQMEKMESK